MSDRVLLVEDDRAIRNLVTLLLNREGYKVDGVENGQKAISCIASTRYSAVLLDLMMPVSNGLDVLAWLKATKPDVAKACVIVLSAASDRDLQQVNKDDVFAIVRKPFDTDELLLTIRSCIATNGH